MVLNILAIIVKLLPAIVMLIKMAEEAFREKPKSGAEKKALVMEGVEAVAFGMDAATTGGAAETWARIKGPVGKIVDGIVTILYPHAPEPQGMVNP